MENKIATLNYDQARYQIDDGDLIAVCGRDSIVSTLTRFFTRSAYTHTGIAVWLDSGLWMMELNGGRNHAIPMS
ncbi:hypothetical protein [Undibacterium sp.]|uniref:hypothetical protein n=1 Tax=Undibacterium sp. TaxID=1914977 RepID=UPI00374D141A